MDQKKEGSINKAVIRVIIPALNEEESVHKVVAELLDQGVAEVVVVDNNSTDDTAEVASNAGATVIKQPIKGYGGACLKGMDFISTTGPTDIVVFIDADYADYPEELQLLTKPIQDGKFDMVIGSRALGKRESGSLTIPQIFGNWLATKMIHGIFGFRFTDLGPFRAIRYSSLLKLQMVDPNYGWTVEMQVKALKQGLRCTEAPVSYRNRIGVSKVSGTVKGSIMAGYKIIATILKYA